MSIDFNGTQLHWGATKAVANTDIDAKAAKLWVCPKCDEYANNCCCPNMGRKE